MKKMNVKFLAGTAFAVGAAAVLSGCTISEPAVYGPEPTEQIETQSDDTENLTTEEETLSVEKETQDTFSPETEVQETVYGPPEDFE